jgi:ferrous iron transport protein A
MLLSELKKGEFALIVEVGDGDPRCPRVIRLLAMGLLEGSSVEVVHLAPFGGDPMIVRVRGTLIALKRSEASRVKVYG